MSFSTLAQTLLPLRVAVAPLASRAVTRLAGGDARKFAQKLITNDIHLLHPSTAPTLHAAVLAPQGRILHDVFLTAEHENSLLIDHCAATADQLRALLRRYRMRADVEIEPLADRRVVALMTRAPLDAVASLIARDPRLDALGYRGVLADAAPLERALRDANVAFTRVDESIYDLYRTCLGVPSDPVEIATGVSLPAEATLDYLNAISYSKGCYVGQELTARTHFIGTTRKMLIPIVPVGADADKRVLDVPDTTTLFGQWRNSVFAPSSFGLTLPPTGTELVGQSRGRRAAGKVMRGDVWGAGFALIRLEHLPNDDIGSVEFEWSANDESGRVRAIEPHWWHAQQQAVQAVQASMT